MHHRQATLEKLRNRLANNQPILICTAGSGIVAKSLEEADIDLIAVSSEARFAMMGFGRAAAHFPMGSATSIALDYGIREIHPLVKVPVVLGVAATDPSWNHDDLLNRARSSGFAGIQNCPTVSALGEGHYRDMIDDSGYTFEREVLLLAKAREYDLISIGYGVREDEIEQLAKAQVDIICVHLGLSAGRSRIAARTSLMMSREDAAKRIDKLCSVALSCHPSAIVLGDGGPVQSSEDLEYILTNTRATGYVLGIQIENVAVEEGVTQLARRFKKIPIPWIDCKSG